VTYCSVKWRCGLRLQAIWEIVIDCYIQEVEGTWATSFSVSIKGVAIHEIHQAIPSVALHANSGLLRVARLVTSSRNGSYPRHPWSAVCGLRNVLCCDFKFNARRLTGFMHAELLEAQASK
jgi:hypothetical protein